MGWTFKWVSSGGSDFNFDYQTSFTPEEMAAKRALYNFTLRDPKAREREGHSVFYKDQGGALFHTYSCYDRGNDKLNLHYHYLDLVPKGRDEGSRGPIPNTFASTTTTVYDFAWLDERLPMRQVAFLFVVSLCIVSPVLAQSRLYTNADLGRPHARTRTPTVEEMQGLLDHQFTLSSNYDGPKALILPYDPSWPFTYAQRLEPDPWRTPGAWPFYAACSYPLNPFGTYPRPYAFAARYNSKPHVRDATRGTARGTRTRSRSERHTECLSR